MCKGDTLEVNSHFEGNKNEWNLVFNITIIMHSTFKLKNCYKNFHDIVCYLIKHL